MKLTAADLADLREAKKILTNSSFAAKLTHVLAAPVKKGFDLLPEKWATIVHAATQKAIEQALKFALLTMREKDNSRSSPRLHKMLVTASGAAGGAFGLLSLAIELPITTVIMLRSILDIARNQGEDIHSPETILNCLQVFALGGETTTDDTTEVGYYAVRAALSKAISRAARYLTQRELAEEGAPAIVRLISMIAARFGIVVSDKVAAMAIPFIGAAGGATVNIIFMDHFQIMARGHFTMRRLERIYGEQTIRQAYEELVITA
ncbi:MAG: EcsC family protein [candidate division KSB1 bacterium]|nr:EcsC family protein [candidate division KSB1 bacterium]